MVSPALFLCFHFVPKIKIEAAVTDDVAENIVMAIRENPNTGKSEMAKSLSLISVKGFVSELVRRTLTRFRIVAFMCSL